MVARSGIGPWELKQEGDKYYGRGTADNKGQHSVNMAALQTVLDERGKLGRRPEAAGGGDQAGRF